MREASCAVACCLEMSPLTRQTKMLKDGLSQLKQSSVVVVRSPDGRWICLLSKLVRSSVC